MFKKIYCPKCAKENNYSTKNAEETYDVKGETISIMTEVAFCNECSEKVFCEELDSKTLSKAYKKYREKEGKNV